MLFITNRAIKQRETSRADRKITLRCRGAASAASVFFCEWRGEQAIAQGCFKRISVVCHSMGALVALSKITNWASNHGVAPLVFRHIFMHNPDTPIEVLHLTHPDPSLADSAGTVSVYYAADDLAMQASRVLNLDRAVSRRLGQTGPEDTGNVPNSLFAINCYDFNTSYDIPDGHSDFLNDDQGNPGGGLKHMASTLFKYRPDRSNGVEGSGQHGNSFMLSATYT